MNKISEEKLTIKNTDKIDVPVTELENKNISIFDMVSSQQIKIDDCVINLKKVKNITALCVHAKKFF